MDLVVDLKRQPITNNIMDISNHPEENSFIRLFFSFFHWIATFFFLYNFCWNCMGVHYLKNPLNGSHTYLILLTNSSPFYKSGFNLKGLDGFR
jgi:hypothetical protein